MLFIKNKKHYIITNELRSLAKNFNKRLTLCINFEDGLFKIN